MMIALDATGSRYSRLGWDTSHRVKPSAWDTDGSPRTGSAPSPDADSRTSRRDCAGGTGSRSGDWRGRAAQCRAVTVPCRPRAGALRWSRGGPDAHHPRSPRQGRPCPRLGQAPGGPRVHPASRRRGEAARPQPERVDGRRRRPLVPGHRGRRLAHGTASPHARIPGAASRSISGRCAEHTTGSASTERS